MSTKDRVLDAAENRIRIHGYHGFSFRDVAADVGVKSSSVHYHFPDKATLAAATAHRYAERFIAALGDPHDDRVPKAKVETVRDAFRLAHTRDGMMCLCGALGAEATSLPTPVHEEASQFFKALTQWLSEALEGEDRKRIATQCVALLEGALLVARTLDDVDVFDNATAALWQLLSPKTP